MNEQLIVAISLLMIVNLIISLYHFSYVKRTGKLIEEYNCTIQELEHNINCLQEYSFKIEEEKKYLSKRNNKLTNLVSGYKKNTDNLVEKIKKIKNDKK